MKIIILLSILTFKVIQCSDTSINLSNCGLNTVKVRRRIVGGLKADVTKYPWIVTFQKYNSKKHLDHFCGGAIINQRWIVSASHCFNGVKNSIQKVRAVMGTSVWKDGEQKGTVYEIEKALTHEGYDVFNYANDIALIKTKTPIKFKSDSKFYSINSICVPSPDITIPTSANVYGWGLMGELLGKSDTLLETTLNKFDSTKCENIYKENIGKLSDQMMCYYAPGKDACQGDSGGPLSQTIKGKEYQIGIVSFGNGCGKEGYPGIYTNVALYHDWILKTIEEN